MLRFGVVVSLIPVIRGQLRVASYELAVRMQKPGIWNLGAWRFTHSGCRLADGSALGARLRDPSVGVRATLRVGLQSAGEAATIHNT